MINYKKPPMSVAFSFASAQKTPLLVGGVKGR